MSTATGAATHALPPEVVAAITSAIAATLERDPADLLFTFRGPFPRTRPDAGSYHLAGRLHPSTPRRGGRS